MKNFFNINDTNGLEEGRYLLVSSWATDGTALDDEDSPDNFVIKGIFFFDGEKFHPNIPSIENGWLVSERYIIEGFINKGGLTYTGNNGRQENLSL